VDHPVRGVLCPAQTGGGFALATGSDVHGGSA
jgi:hypothetical protein